MKFIKGKHFSITSHFANKQLSIAVCIPFSLAAFKISYKNSGCEKGSPPVTVIPPPLFYDKI